MPVTEDPAREKERLSPDDNHDNNNTEGSLEKKDLETVEHQTGAFHSARTLKSILLLIALTLVGIAFSLLGSTFVDLQQYLSTDARVLSLAMPLSSAGLIVASLMAIFRLNKVSVEISMVMSIICISLITTIWTMVPSIYWFLGLSIIHGFCACLLLCEMQPYFLQLWANHRLQKPMLLAIYGLMTLGLAIGPFLVTPFLSNHGHHGHHGHHSEADLNATLANTTTEYTGHVKHAFMVLGLPIALPGILYCIVCFKRGASLWRNVQNSSHHGAGDAKNIKKISKSDKKILVILTLCFYFCSAICEFLPLSFFTLYVSSLLGWVPPQSTLINSAFNGALCAGRLIGIPVAACMRPRTILAVNLTAVLCAASLLLLSTVHAAFVWAGAAVLGLGISLIFGTMLLWLSETLKVTDRLMAAIICSNALGGIVGPPVTGQLFVLVSPICLIIMILGAASCASVIYVVLRILERRRKSRYDHQEEIGIKK